MIFSKQGFITENRSINNKNRVVNHKTVSSFLNFEWKIDWFSEPVSIHPPPTLIPRCHSSGPRPHWLRSRSLNEMTSSIPSISSPLAAPPPSGTGKSWNLNVALDLDGSMTLVLALTLALDSVCSSDSHWDWNMWFSTLGFLFYIC
jgi:hypothetical protein